MGRMLLMHDSSHPNSKLLTVAYSYVSTMLYYSNGTRGSFLVNAHSRKNTNMWATHYVLLLLHELRATERTT
jgi:hypothetical protein